MELPLNGLRILDISRGVAASFCTMILAEYGAEVIKIESPMGDTVRYNPPLYENEGTSFIGLNRNKKSIQLDVNQAEERSMFLALASTADVVVENFRPGVMTKLGIDYPALCTVNSRIIMCSVTAFGQNGHWRDKPAHDNTLLGLSGMLQGLSFPDGTPPRPVPFLAGMAGGSMWAVIGILLALAERRITGEGRHVDVSMFHGLQAIMIPELITQTATGQPQNPGRTWNSGLYPGWNNYRTKDGFWMTLAAVEPKFWNNFCELFAADDLKPYGIPYMDTDGAICGKIAEIIGAHTREELLQKTRKRDVLLEPVYTLEESLDTPPARDFGALFHIFNQTHVPYPQIKLPLVFGADCPRHLHPAQGQHQNQYLPAASAGTAAPNVLIIYHSQKGKTVTLAQTLANEIGPAADCAVNIKKAGQTNIRDILQCRMVLIICPQYLGHAAGAIKDLFDRICLATEESEKDRLAGLGYALLISAEQDERVTVKEIETLAATCQWRQITNSACVSDTSGRATEETLTRLAQAVVAHIALGSSG